MQISFVLGATQLHLEWLKHKLWVLLYCGACCDMLANLNNNNNNNAEQGILGNKFEKSLLFPLSSVYHPYLIPDIPLSWAAQISYFHFFPC